MFLELNHRQFLDCLNLSDGLFFPLTSFLDKKNLDSVLSKMRLQNGEVWAYPLSLDVSHKDLNSLENKDFIQLSYNSHPFADFEINEIFEIDKNEFCLKFFGTKDPLHPGVDLELQKSNFRIAGSLNIFDQNLFAQITSCSAIKEKIISKGFSTTVGFQTRNPLHMGHEHIQRTVMEIYDGLLINPLVGWKKKGDFTEKAIMEGYKAMVDEYYNKSRVILAPLKTTMLYAGPKEAIHHALMRRNMGCSHFIVGRDHAGVGSFYDKYEAHQFINNMQTSGYDFGIKFLLIKEPVYCIKCEQYVSEKSCGHDAVVNHKSISGTDIRDHLINNRKVNNLMLRKEVEEVLLKLDDELFVK